MVPLLHIGMSPAMLHPGWANVEDPGLIRLLSVLQPSQSAEIFLTAIVIGGVFERHPDLTILISELGIDWLPELAEKLDGMAAGAPARWSWASTGCPSPRRSTSAAMCASRRCRRRTSRRSSSSTRLPGVAVFSSDFPHFEGNGEPLPYYRDLLAEVDDDILDGFLGGSIADAYERMGDPL